MSSLLFPAYKLTGKNTQTENICDIVYEKAKGRGGTVKRTSVYGEAKVSLKKMFREILQNSQENIFARISFLVLSCHF